MFIRKKCKPEGNKDDDKISPQAYWQEEQLEPLKE